jgi:hypothetical protein
MWKELIIYGVLNILEPKIVSELSLLQQQQGTVIRNDDVFLRNVLELFGLAPDPIGYVDPEGQKIKN